MPIFEYRCPTCHHDFELLIRGKETARCPTCQSARVEKLFSAPAAPVLGGLLPIAAGCAPEGPPCRPGCCRLPQ